MPPLVTFIPYADDRNLGAAYNECMEMLPEDGWAVLLDHDVMFTTREWHRQIADAIATVPEGCFSGVTNRIKCPFQQVEGVSMKNHDIRYHREVGKRLLSNLNLHDVTDEVRTPSGFLICLSKRAWLEIGKFPNGLHYLDRTIWEALRAVGRRLYIIEGLYVYHWHRGGGPDSEPFVAGEWVKRHQLPDGRVVAWQTPPGGFPVYVG